MALEPNQHDSAPPGTIDVQVPADSPTSFSAMSPDAPASGGAEEGVETPRRGGRLVGPRRQRIIVVGIVAAFLVSALSIGILYAKWYSAEPHSATIIVWGDDKEPGWEGGRVTVTGTGLNDGPLVADLSPRDHLLVRFHVPTGDFRVRVTAKDG